MRKSLCSLFLTGALFVAGSAAFAQSDSPAQQPAPMAGMHHGMNPDEQLARMTKNSISHPTRQPRSSLSWWTASSR